MPSFLHLPLTPGGRKLRDQLQTYRPGRALAVVDSHQVTVVGCTASRTEVRLLGRRVRIPSPGVIVSIARDEAPLVGFCAGGGKAGERLNRGRGG